MFDREVYQGRRDRLKQRISSGLVLLMGNRESPVNYPDNVYPFRQDSSFLYFFGIQRPGLAGLIDLDTGQETLFGDDYTLDQVVWMGPRPGLDEMGRAVGVERARPYARLREVLVQAMEKDRRIMILPPYRGSRWVALEEALGLPKKAVRRLVSRELIGAVVALREVKEDREVAEIEKALAVTQRMQLRAMSMARPGVTEKEIAIAVGAEAASLGGQASELIATVQGQTLHQMTQVNTLEQGDLFILDGGAQSELCYASDITRTFPVGGRFDPRQRDIYETVLAANLKAASLTRPGVAYREVFLAALSTIASGLKEMGLMKGDPAQAAAQGAVSLFMPHGLGHQMGLDIHDMEDLGEDYVGYDKEIARDTRFGLSALRFGRKLFPGLVLTNEPGCYFIPDLIDRWRTEGRFKEFIDYDKVDKFRDFSGVRIEDDILVTDSGCRVLGPPIAKTAAEVEEAVAGGQPS